MTYRNLPRPAEHMGVMLDASALHPWRTGRETCRLVASTIGNPKCRADELLEEVGIGPAATRRVKHYSLGMRQRLSPKPACVTPETAGNSSSMPHRTPWRTSSPTQELRWP